MQHPNIVQIHEVGEQDGLPYFSLEFVDGEPLNKKITGIPQPPREAAQLIETLARAMYFAHQQGIVHRDLKPANILMTQAQLGKQPGAVELKRELLETAMNGLKRVAGGAAGKMRRTTSDAYFKMGGIARELGNTAEAIKYWQQYYEMAESALKDNPNDERLKLEMAWACRFLGEISVERGDLRKALAFYQSALALRKELAAVPLAERIKRNEKLAEENRLTPRLNELQLSEDFTRVGLIYYYLGDSAQAEEPVLKSLALREKLASQIAMDQVIWSMNADPAAGPTLLSIAARIPGLEQVSEARQNLARNYHLIAEIYFRLRNLSRSRIYYQKCEETREAILRNDEIDVERRQRIGKPRPPDFRLMADLAEFHQMYGAMLFSLGAPTPEVLPHIDRSIALSRRVLEIDKAVASRQNLAKALYSRGVVAARLGDPATAAKCFHECACNSSRARRQRREQLPQKAGFARGAGECRCARKGGPACREPSSRPSEERRVPDLCSALFCAVLAGCAGKKCLEGKISRAGARGRASRTSSWI